MFIAQAFKSRHEWWRYVVGIIVVFLAAQLGSIPFLFAVIIKTLQDGGSMHDLDTATMMTVLDSNLTLFLMLLSFAVGLVALLFIIKYLHKQPLIEATTSRKKIDWGRFWVGFALIGVTAVVLTGIDFYTNPQNYEVQFQWGPFLVLALIVIIFIPLQTSMEEYVFRGYLMQGIGASVTRRRFPLVVLCCVFIVAVFLLLNRFFNMSYLYSILLTFILLVILLIIIINTPIYEYISKTPFYERLFTVLKRSFTPLFLTSVVFGLLHIANPEVDKLGNIIMVYYIGTGFLLGIMTLMDEGLELALGFHAGNNMIAALLVTADWTVFQTNSILKDISEPSVGIDLILPLIITYPIFLFILAKKYKWTNWKEKLFGKVEKPEIIAAETQNGL